MNFITAAKLTIWATATTTWAFLSSAFNKDGFEPSDFANQTRDAAVLVGLAVASVELAEQCYKAYKAYTPKHQTQTESPANAQQSISELPTHSARRIAETPSDEEEGSDCYMSGVMTKNGWKLEYYG